MKNIPKWPQILFNQSSRKENLIHTQLLLNELGNPEKKLPPVIHIAGTNGKGSTQAMLKSIFENANYKVHSYTSPHLRRFNERTYLAGNYILDEHLNNVIERTRLAAERCNIQPSFFVGTTVASFIAFAEIYADILILETGMGGANDPTNIIKNPIATIITPIAFDHMEYLGNDIESIAKEKAGIIKDNVPCIISCQMDKVYDILIETCYEKNAPSLCYSYDFTYQIENNNEFQYLSQTHSIQLPQPSLLGHHQIINSTVVVAAILSINNQFSITLNNIKNGLVNTYWPGRIEKINTAKCKQFASNNIDIFLDGAHNDLGASVLSNWITNTQNDYECTYLLLGMTNTRSPISFVTYFANCITKIYTLNVISEPQSFAANDLKNLLHKDLQIEVESAPSLENAISSIDRLSDRNKKTRIIITGSLFLVGDALNIMK